jgi:1-acyl-sn-glycerol-3-phosphate acyltransferase
MDSGGQMMVSRSTASKLWFCFLGSVHAVFFFFSLFFTGNVLPVFALLFVRPFHAGTYEKLLCFLAELNFKTITDWSEFVGGLDLVITGDAVPDTNAILVSNHVSFSDSILIHAFARR